MPVKFHNDDDACDSGKLGNYKQNAKSQKKRQQQEIECLNFLPDTLMNQKDKERWREGGEREREGESGRICRSLLACELAPAISM